MTIGTIFSFIMNHPIHKKPTWKAVLEREQPLLLPAAHDALTAKLIELAGFPAYQIGGFALNGTRHAWPDLDLAHLKETSDAVEEIIGANNLPVLVDCDDGYGDVKNVSHTVHTYESLGVSAIFIEDQQAPKKCGHMQGKEVIPPEDMAAKIKAAVGARASRENLFLIARSDALQKEGVKGVIKRLQLYHESGADGLYVEGVKDEEQLKFKGIPLAVSVLEGGGKTPFLSPEKFKEYGFSMVLYPTTVLFQMVPAIQKALENLKSGQPMEAGRSINMDTFESIVDVKYWEEIEKKYKPEQ
jgi:2-methylisocitrate lyase-like PEP mutase family enzyme